MAKKSSRSKRTAADRSTRGVKARTSRQALCSEPIDAASTSAPSPEHWRYLRAVTELLESDEDYTTRALARRLGMSPEALWKFRYEHSDVTQWVSDQLAAHARAMAGPLLRRVAELAQAGSTEHADLLLRVVSRAWTVTAVTETGGQAGPLIVNVVVGDGQATA